MKTSLYVLNDRLIEMHLRVMDNRFSPATGEGEIWHTIAPSAGKLIEIDIPDDSVPFFKIWESNTAMLSYAGKDLV